MRVLKFSEVVYRQISETIGKFPPECGGILGARESGLITEYYFDVSGTCSPKGYAPDVQRINEILINDWNPRGVIMVGIVHSHANGVIVPSCGDINYGIRILQALDTVDEFYLPIVTVGETMRMQCYVVSPDPERQFVCRRLDYDVVTL